jgi:hypothetical protein
MEEIMKLGDPNNPCGPKANPGPDGGCGEDEPQEEPGLPGIGPDCEVCGTHQLQANAPAMNAGNMMNNKGGQGSIPMGKGGFPGK